MTPLALYAQARDLLLREVAIGRRCRVCDQPTGSGRRALCGSVECAAEAHRQHRARRAQETKVARIQREREKEAA